MLVANVGRSSPLLTLLTLVDYLPTNICDRRLRFFPNAGSTKNRWTPIIKAQRLTNMSCPHYSQKSAEVSKHVGREVVHVGRSSPLLTLLTPVDYLPTNICDQPLRFFPNAGSTKNRWTPIIKAQRLPARCPQGRPPL